MADRFVLAVRVDDDLGHGPARAEFEWPGLGDEVGRAGGIPGEPPGGVGVRSGTSMAAAHVSGVAARILEMHPQTLRKYERIGLLTPSRTVGMLRLYSEEDIARLRLIKHLVGELGLNLAGVHLALGIFNQLLDMRSRLHLLEGQLLKSSLEDKVDEMFELLQTGLP